MRAIQVSGPGADFELVTIEIPEPKHNEVLIKVEAYGICHGDVLVSRGTAKVRFRSDLKIGDRND